MATAELTRPAARPAAAPKKNPNALLMAFRKYHTWLGVGLTGFIVLIAATGIYLNHKVTFNAVLPLPAKPAGPPLLTTATDPAALPVGVAAALAAARDRYGDVPVEKVELKAEGGRLAVLVKTAAGELAVVPGPDGPAAMPADEYEAAERQARGTNWGKIIKDLHTGKVAGLAGKLTADFTAVVLAALCATGVYLWAVPLLRKRRSARQRAAASAG